MTIRTEMIDPTTPWCVHNGRDARRDQHCAAYLRCLP
jgi:hypothetical protein